MAYELTIMLGFHPSAPGVPIGIKLADKFKPFVPLDRLLDEDTGARLAAWARGDLKAAAPARAPARAPAPPAEPPPSDEPPFEPPGEQHGPPPQDGPPPDWFPGDPWPPGTAPAGERPAGEPPAGERPAGGELPLGGPPPSRRPSKRAVAEELIARFEAVKVRADHLAIVDDKTNRERVTWLKKTREKHPELADRLETAMKASWDRTDPRKEQAA